MLPFEDRRQEQALSDQPAIGDTRFSPPNPRHQFGGRAANIAYTLKLLGDTALPVAVVGRDFAPYAAWMDHHGIPRTYVTMLEEERTAQAFFVADREHSDIAAFHPGAMDCARASTVGEAKGVALGVIAPVGPIGMVEHADQFCAAGIPFLFDPGQGLSMFDGAEIRRFVAKARWIIVNEYEWELLQQKTDWAVRDFTTQVDALIVTRGSRGSEIYARSEVIRIPCATPKSVVDPIGCGDAYRAGVIHGLLHGLDWQTTGEIASMLGAIKIETQGRQNHRFTRREFRKRFESNFGSLGAGRLCF